MYKTDETEIIPSGVALDPEAASELAGIPWVFSGGGVRLWEVPNFMLKGAEPRDVETFLVTSYDESLPNAKPERKVPVNKYTPSLYFCIPVVGIYIMYMIMYRDDWWIFSSLLAGTALIISIMCVLGYFYQKKKLDNRQIGPNGEGMFPLTNDFVALPYAAGDELWWLIESATDNKYVSGIIKEKLMEIERLSHNF